MMDGGNNDELNLLLSYADDHKPVLEDSLPTESAGEQDPESAGENGFESFFDAGAAGNDLAAQGWGVIAPEGKRGDELLGRIKRLIDWRNDQLEDPVKIYRVPSRMTPEEAMKWRNDVYNNDDPDFIPRYQLILGDLHEVPFELQAVQSSEGYVGRLAFSDREGYESYVDKVLMWEQSPSPLEQGNSLFYTVHDGTAATQAGYRGLITPVVERARAMKDSGRFAAGNILEAGDEDPTPEELLEAAAELEAGVLFTMSHGCGAPRKGWSSARAQLKEQGAMSFGVEGNLPGRDLEHQVFVPGGIWFMFACFGAGTPSRSKFRHWLEHLKREKQFRGRPDSVLKSLPNENQRPFIAALPQAALASADGPLAFVGHLDLAWTYSFSELDGGKQKGSPDKFYNILKSLFRGNRAGVALLELMRFYVDKNQQLTELYDLASEAKMSGKPSPVSKTKLGHLWMTRQDLSGYILLGDPAVKLPLSPAKKSAKKSHPTHLRTAMVVRSRAEDETAKPTEEPSSFSTQNDPIHEVKQPADGEGTAPHEEHTDTAGGADETTHPAETNIDPETAPTPAAATDAAAVPDAPLSLDLKTDAPPMETPANKSIVDDTEPPVKHEDTINTLKPNPTDDPKLNANANINSNHGKSMHDDVVASIPEIGNLDMPDDTTSSEGRTSDRATAPLPQVPEKSPRTRSGEVGAEAVIDEGGETDPERPIRVRWRFSWKFE